MFRSLTVCAAFSILSLAGSIARAEYRSVGLIPPETARQFGLDRAWFTTVELDPARGRMAHMLYHVSSSHTHAVYVVNYEDRKRWFSEQDLDRFGDELGRERAKKRAKDFMQDLEAQGIEGQPETMEVPEITLYVVTDRAMVQAIDAETGRTRWSKVIGNRNYPTERPGVSEEHVAVINGTTLYLLKRDTGEIVWSRQVRGVPSAGPAITLEYIVVPTFTGVVELYDIDETATLPEMYMSNGRVLIQPTVTPLSVAWPTDRGFMYVARTAKMGLRYRLEAKDTIAAQPAYFSPSKLLAASIDGYVYCIHETSGKDIWRFSTGEPISNTPVPIGDSAYVVTDKGSLFCLDLETGVEKWWSPGIHKFIAASKDRLYGLSSLGRLAILDAKTGGRIATMGMDLLDVHYPNLETDRIIVGTKAGVIQCLRETQLQWPLIHVDLAEAEKLKQEEIEQEHLPSTLPKVQPGGPKPKAGVDPFGTPIGGQGGQNPFGGGANPFGGGQGAGQGGGAGANPFGGGQGAGQGAGQGGGAGNNPFN